MTEENAALVRDLQSLINFLGAHPELPLPTFFDFSIYEFGDEDLALARTIAKAFGTFDKDIGASIFTLKKRFGKVALRFIFHRDSVCARRVIGTKTETKMVPASTAKMVEKVVETEIVEWDCPTLLDDQAPPKATEPPPPPFPRVDRDDDIPF